MNKRTARQRAKELYGPRAFVRRARNGLLDILLDVAIEGTDGLLLGWGSTWEEAFQLARKRAGRYEKKKKS